MEVISINPQNPEPGAITKAAECIRKGFVVLIPTDTVYGLAANALDEAAVARVFALKKRPATKAIPLLVKNVAMARKLAYIADAVAERLQALWPGAVTAVLYKKDIVPDRAAGGGQTIALYISAHPAVSALVRAADLPLTGTSANISGQPSCMSVAAALEQFNVHGSQPDLVLDAGTLPPAQPSTVIDLTSGRPQLLRVGPVTKRELQALWDKRSK